MNPLSDALIVPRHRAALWRYAAWFWGGFAVLSYVQVTVWVWLTGGQMHYTDTLHWLVRWGLWLASSPLILWAAHRHPIRPGTGGPVLMKQLGIHLGLITALSALVTALEYGLMIPLEYWAIGQATTAKDALAWFFSRYSTFVAIYMLIVAGYQMLTASSQNQRLQEQASNAERHLEQIQAQLERAHLQALKMQLNPHFLFNTHHTIIGLILNGEHQKAIQMLRLLSTLLRTIVDGEDVQVVPLEAELNFIQSYLRIQQIRYQDWLRVQIEVGPEAGHAEVPQFILQPLVENAFVHGLERVAGPVSLLIRASVSGAALTICIQDNGAGMPARPAGRGVGLRNTHRRLDQLYGERASLRLTPTPGGGTTCLLRLPFIRTSLTADRYDTNGTDRR